MLKNPSSEYLIERSLDELHQQSVKWNSDIELWKIELNFFQKLLDKYSVEFDTVDEKKEIDHFQNLITYYSGELLDEFRQLVRRHETTLAKDFAVKGKVDEAAYRATHLDLMKRIYAFDNEFKAYKKEFFTFIEKAL